MLPFLRTLVPNTAIRIRTVGSATRRRSVVRLPAMAPFNTSRSVWKAVTQTSLEFLGGWLVHEHEGFAAVGMLSEVHPEISIEAHRAAAPRIKRL